MLRLEFVRFEDAFSSFACCLLFEYGGLCCSRNIAQLDLQVKQRNLPNTSSVWEGNELCLMQSGSSGVS